MVGLLTWTTYGTWLAGGRGRIEHRGPVRALPEPMPRDPAARDKAAKWSAVVLDHPQQQKIVDDLARIAELRDFAIHAVAVEEDHVHLLFETKPGHCEAETDQSKLVQLIKGALSRALTVAAGDAPAHSLHGGALPHHKWWTRQYSLLTVGDRESYELIRDRLEGHGGGVVRVVDGVAFEG